MCTQSALKIILNKVAGAYQSVYGKNLDKVILYGSYARGDNKPDSDIDIVAIVTGKREALQRDIEKVRDVSFDLGLEYDTLISPTVIPLDEFNKYKEDLPYYRNINQEGVIISGY